MKTETVEYKDGGTTFRYLAYDEKKSGKRPGIPVTPVPTGLGDHAKERAERLARLGYIALAGDPYGNGTTVQTAQEAMKLAMPLLDDPAKLRHLGHLALNKLMSLPQTDTSKLAEIGFSMGGSFGLELARDGAPLAAVAAFHAGLQTKSPAEPGKVKAKILVQTGADDPLVPFDQIKAFEEEMTRAGADWQLISYGGTKHGFTNPEAAGNPAITYNKTVDDRSCRLMVSFLEEPSRSSGSDPFRPLSVAAEGTRDKWQLQTVPDPSRLLPRAS